MKCLLVKLPELTTQVVENYKDFDFKSGDYEPIEIDGVRYHAVYINGSHNASIWYNWEEPKE